MRPGSERAAPAVAAVDFGATSVRVCRVELGAPPRLDVVHRYEHRAARAPDGHLRWDWPRLVAEMHRGLDAVTALGPIASIGVDTWGVDYGLLDGRGALLAPPASYRDDRTAGWRAVVERIGADRLFAVTGTQLLAINTIFQLAAEDRDLLDRAAHVVMLPELLVHELTGTVVAERTSAGTTGLLDLSTGCWSEELCDAIGVDARLLPAIAEPTTPVGAWRGVPVHLVGGHDTASAVAAGARDGAAFVSSGTWLLVGCETTTPDTSEAARHAGLTNEQAALGGIRLLRNLAGFWLLEECRRAWGEPPIDELLALADPLPAGPVVDVTDERFTAPVDMEAEIRAAAAGLAASAGRAAVVRCILDSLAAGVASVVATLPPVDAVRVFGGGARVTGLLQAIHDRSGLPVAAGPVEATALGNAAVQGVALGAYRDLADARAALDAPEIAA